MLAADVKCNLSPILIELQVFLTIYQHVSEKWDF